ncbi:TonB family protein [Megasphaera elsdenii]|uniref:TonB family protein n=1 Tax=Megasphaera elsdenii TaxID=907 RepID=UPI001D010FBE|nr:TonB family protein [Megasphaera elsdenii]MCB5702934.1 TonB family protein [Megasphaera elsdenii]MCB5727741.1 TonB family protein [Megasphaera elsdenii]MCB5771520.1 TonB family protein [Megasphaera elsdenii]
MEGISWKRAYAGSLLIHLVVAGLLAVGLAGSVAQHEQEKMYVVDLDASDLTDSGSGHAGGGGGGSSSASLFPDKLSETDMAQRTAAVQAQSSALTPPEQVTQAQSILAEASEKAAASVASAAQAPLPGAPSDTGSSTAAGSRDGGSSRSGSGSGTGEGNGEGSGSGSGTGSGSGDGQGYGQGTGDGQGSGDSGAAGTGSAPFDSDGFWSAVNANKSYPPMAIKRGLTGTVTVTVVLDSSGNCVSASADSSGLLAKAAVNAVYAACPYPNGTGSTVTVHVPVTFNIQ